MPNQTDTRSSEQIRRDLEGARSELHHTVDALEHRLSPGQVVDELWGRVRGTSTDESSVRVLGDMVRRHPAPAALIGLGLAWMAMDKTGTRRVDRAEATAGSAGGDESGMQKVKKAAGVALGAVQDKAHRAAEKATDTVKSKTSDAAGSVREGVKERVSGARARASGWREQAGERLRGGGDGGWSVRSSIDQQPLAAGAFTFGLGLAAGLVTPSTRREDRLMGSTADAVKDEALRATKDVAKSAKDVAEDVAEAVKDEALAQDVPGRLKNAANEIGRAAREEVRERAGEEEIDPSGIRRRASHVGEEIRSRSGKPEDS